MLLAIWGSNARWPHSSLCTAVAGAVAVFGLLVADLVGFLSLPLSLYCLCLAAVLLLSRSGPDPVQQGDDAPARPRPAPPLLPFGARLEPITYGITSYMRAEIRHRLHICVQQVLPGLPC